MDWCLIVVCVGLAAATPRSSSTNPVFCSRVEARLKAVPIRSAEEVLKRTRTPATKAPFRNTELSLGMDLNQDADEHYKDSDPTDMLKQGGHAVKVYVPFCSLN